MLFSICRDNASTRVIFFLELSSHYHHPPTAKLAWALKLLNFFACSSVSLWRTLTLTTAPPTSPTLLKRSRQTSTGTMPFWGFRRAYLAGVETTYESTKLRLQPSMDIKVYLVPWYATFQSSPGVIMNSNRPAVRLKRSSDSRSKEGRNPTLLSPAQPEASKWWFHEPVVSGYLNCLGRAWIYRKIQTPTLMRHTCTHFLTACMMYNFSDAFLTGAPPRSHNLMHYETKS